MSGASFGWMPPAQATWSRRLYNQLAARQRISEKRVRRAIAVHRGLFILLGYNVHSPARAAALVRDIIGRHAYSHALSLHRRAGVERHKV
jgi:hypothetical protein